MQRQLEEGDLIPLFNQNEFNISDRQETPSFNTLRPKRRPRVNPLLIVLVLGILLFIIIVSALNSTSQPKVIETKPDPVKVEPPPSKNAKNHISFNNLGSLYSTSPNDLEWTTTGRISSTMSQGKPIYAQEYVVSPLLDNILFSTDFEKGWRHSHFANYFIYNIKSKKTNPLTTSISDKIIEGELGSGKVSLALWSNSSHVAWVRDNDLFITRITASGNHTEIRITNDGSKKIINGIADWVYEEEVLASHTAMWFSPDGDLIAYLKFNETLVPEYKFQMYETPHSTYNRDVSVKYPKPGFPNPVVSLHISSTTVLGEDSAVYFNTGEVFEESDCLIVEVIWASSDTLLIRLMNRVQDHQRVYTVTKSDRDIWTATMVRDEPSKDDAWFNILQPITLIHPTKNRKDVGYVELMEDEAGFTHIAYFKTLGQKTLSIWLTFGNFEVTKIAGIDQENGIIYFMSTDNRHPTTTIDSTQRHLFSVTFDGKTKNQLSPPKGISFDPLVPSFKWSLFDNIANNTVGVNGFYESFFSPKSGYYILSYTGPDIPFSRLLKVNSDWIHEIENNDNIRHSILNYDLPLQKYFTIKNDNGDDMNAKIIVPPGFSENAGIRYPVLMRVYGGPGSQIVEQKYNIDYMNAIADAGFVALFVDGRGTGFKGRSYRSCVSKKLGFYETQDQIAAAKFLATMSFIDATRIAIWGWSYGGYMAAKVIEANSGVFQLGISVAPVTDWRYYDSIYTERFMKTPQLNSAGYEESAVLKMEGFRKASFLVCHGTADDNVHFANTADLVWHLTGASVKEYRMQMYVDSDHNIAAGNAYVELYHLMRSFLFEKFKVEIKI